MVRIRELTVPGLSAPLEWRQSARARRLSLRVDGALGTVRVVAPPDAPERQVAAFVVRHLEWVRRRLEALPPRRDFVPGAVLPVMGVAHRIAHDPAWRGRPRLVPGEGGPVLMIGGDREFFARRVRDWLKVEARRCLIEASRAKAASLGLRIAGVAVRDTRSRWGSCSPEGRLSFSWRLILAPPEVFDYVVAHEVAHLKEMNHSSRFWRVCAQLTRTDVGAAKAWLKANGAALHRFGV